MEKIATLFARERRSGKVTPDYNPEVLQPSLEWVATEKLNGINVRLTVRNETVVRLEVRHPPTAKQREDGIVHPWYRDAEPESEARADYWLWNAARNTNLSGVPDGEWEGEAVGPKIQRDSLGLPSHRVFLFSLIPWVDTLEPGCPIPPILNRVPLDYDILQDWLPAQRSGVNDELGIEGVVWWFYDEPVAKIKTSDFRYGSD
jgi:hypothetical protein